MQENFNTKTHKNIFNQLLAKMNNSLNFLLYINTDRSVLIKQFTNFYRLNFQQEIHFYFISVIDQHATGRFCSFQTIENLTQTSSTGTLHDPVPMANSV